MNEFTLLSAEQLYGQDINKNKLSIINKIGIISQATDLAIYKGYNNKWWTKTFSRLGSITCVDNNTGLPITLDDLKSRIGVRPAIKYSSIKQKDIKQMTVVDGVVKIEYGEYPQTKLNENDNYELEKLFIDRKLIKTGKKYVLYISEFNLRHYKEDLFNKNLYKISEYEYNGDKYIRYPRIDDNNLEQYLWFKVEPIIWYVDKKLDIAFSEKVLISNIHFDLPYYNQVYKKSGIYYFLNNIFSKDIKPSKIKQNNEIKNEVLDNVIEKNDIIENKQEETKVNILINDIKAIIKGKSYEEKITKELNNVINKYNDKLDQFKNKDFISIETPNMVVSNMELELTNILDSMKEFNSKGNTYNNMSTYLSDLIKITNKQEINNEELEAYQQEINKLVNISISFLNEEKQQVYLEKLNTLFMQEQNKINKYIESKINLDTKDDYEIHLEYHNNEELIIYLRRKIQPILIDIEKDVRERDIEKTINESTTKIVNATYETTNNKMISLYLNQINEVYQEISQKITYIDEEERVKLKEELKEIINKEIDNTKNINEILKELKIKWLSLNKILYKIDDYINEVNFIDNNKIKF